MDYITVKEASILWNMDVSTIGKLLRAGKIIGATKMGGHWVIPKDAQKPIDGRRKEAKSTKKTDNFRFPLYVNSSENSFSPPLSAEELKLRQAQKDFYACNFNNAKETFEYLSNHAENVYVKICANFFMCLLTTAYDTSINWTNHYGKMLLLLSSEIDHKKEMELFLPWLYCFLALYQSAAEKYQYDFEYNYHPSAWYMNAWLSICLFIKPALDGNQTQYSEPFQNLCHLFERDGHFVEAQELHRILFYSFFIFNNEKAMRYHLKKLVCIAYEHNLIFPVADLASYYPDAISEVLSEYPEEFTKRIYSNSKIIAKNFARFSEKNNISELYSELSESDYRLALYAVGGYTNKQIAEIMKISERTVIKRYNELYDKLSVTGKSELVTTMKAAIGINDSSDNMKEE